MTDEAIEGEGKRLSRWQRIRQFPLVTMLFAVVLYVLVVMLAGVIAKLVLPPIAGLSFENKFALVGAPALVLLYWLVISRLGRNPRNDLRDPRWARNLGIGLLVGVGIFSVAVAVVAALGFYRVTGEGDASGLLAAVIGAAIFPAVSEEIMFRGILFRWIEEFGGSWMAVVVSSALFGLAHIGNPGSGLLAVTGIAFEAGIMLAAAYMLTRSLWLPMGIHAAWNFAQGEIWDIPVSGTDVHGLLTARFAGNPLLTGNGFGLEASPIAIVIATAFGLWLLWLAIRKGEVLPPMWARSRRVETEAPALAA
jgi:membrane protease YdiL (CAAX protease family)